MFTINAAQRYNVFAIGFLLRKVMKLVRFWVKLCMIISHASIMEDWPWVLSVF